MVSNEKFVAASFERLDDDSLSFVSGGGLDPETIGSVLVWSSFGAACVSLGCSFVSTTCKYKAKREKKNGDKESACRLKKVSNAFHDMSVGAGGVCMLSAGGLGAMEIMHRYFSQQV